MQRFVSNPAFSNIKSSRQGLAVLADPEFCPYGDKQPMLNLTTDKDFRQWLHVKTELCRKPTKHKGWFECSYVHDATELQKPKCLYFALAKNCGQGSRCKYQHVALPDQFLVPRPNYFTMLPKQLIEMMLLYALHEPMPPARRPRRTNVKCQPSPYLTYLTVCKRWLQVLSADKFENCLLDLPKIIKTKKIAHFTKLEQERKKLYDAYQFYCSEIKSRWSYFLRCLPLAKQPIDFAKYEDKIGITKEAFRDYKFKNMAPSDSITIDDLKLDIDYKDITFVILDEVAALSYYMTITIARAHFFHHESLVDQLRRTHSFPCPYTDAPAHCYSDEICMIKPGCQHTSICDNLVRWVTPSDFSYYNEVKLDDTEPLGQVDVV